ncbi:hypothetical protein NDU88_012032 [Pleurodeles waltl]|uniref:Uncharacterized protein n=1 Tax=Pleurodeles waltl TaxID=8319 RepID=A0AAV7S7Z4_PLEWA|nr:hypothetical protein NDU88_012032 [Pleurodeles waltl]
MDFQTRVPVEQGDHVQKSQASRRWADAQEMPTEGPGCRQLRLGTQGASRKKEPSQKQAAHAEVPEQALRRGVKWCSPEVAQRGPTSPEDNLASRAMQVRVPWTHAWLCMKEILEECTGAGAAAKDVVPSNAVWRGDARTYLHQTWTEESLDCGSHLVRVAGIKGPRSSC